MNLALLEIPERRTTAMHEVVAFFRDLFNVDENDEPLGWESASERFLRQFSGMAFDVPGPEFFQGIRRDEQIIVELSNDAGIENRLRLLRQHRITYTYLENLSRIGLDKNLDPPHCAVRKQAVKEAAAWLNRFPSLANDVVAMYALNARERAEAVELTRNPESVGERLQQKKPKKTTQHGFTDYQKKVIKALKQHRNARATAIQISHKLGSPLAARAVAALKDHGVITQLKCGDLKLTAKGTKVRV